MIAGPLPCCTTASSSEGSCSWCSAWAICAIAATEVSWNHARWLQSSWRRDECGGTVASRPKGESVDSRKCSNAFAFLQRHYTTPPHLQMSTSIPKGSNVAKAKRVVGVSVSLFHCFVVLYLPRCCLYIRCCRIILHSTVFVLAFPTHLDILLRMAPHSSTCICHLISITVISSDCACDQAVVVKNSC